MWYVSQVHQALKVDLLILARESSYDGNDMDTLDLKLLNVIVIFFVHFVDYLSPLANFCILSHNSLDTRKRMAPSSLWNCGSVWEFDGTCLNR